MECAKEFHPQTGGRSGATILAAFGARLVGSVVFVVGILAWITSVLL